MIDAEFPPFWDHYFLLRDARLLVERGCTDFDVMEKITTENHSALVGRCLCAPNETLPGPRYWCH